MFPKVVLICPPLPPLPPLPPIAENAPASARATDADAADRHIDDAAGAAVAARRVGGTDREFGRDNELQIR
jgi:hypothetical protein